MRRIPSILVVIGIVLVVAAGAWKLAAPSALVKYKSDGDKTLHMVGGLTLYVDPSTTAPAKTPTRFTVDVKARLHVISSNSSTAVVADDQTEKIGPLPAAIAKLQYVLDRRSMKNKADNRAFAYQANTVVNRSPNYSVNFPLHTGNGPYPVWKDETGTPFQASRVGHSTTKINGTSLITMRGTQVNAAVQSYYIATLASQGIPSSLTLAQITPQLKAQGVDPALLQSAVLPRLAPADQTTIKGLLAAPINLRYLMTSTSTWLVEPTSGLPTSVNVDETMSVQPDITGIGRIQTILAKPQYNSDPIVRAGATTLAKLVTSPPTTRVLRIAYAQTPASVSEITDYAQSLVNQVDLVEIWIPLAVLLAGLVLIVAGVVWVLVRHGRARGHGEPALAGGPSGGPSSRSTPDAGKTPRPSDDPGDGPPARPSDAPYPGSDPGAGDDSASRRTPTPKTDT